MYRPKEIASLVRTIPDNHHLFHEISWHSGYRYTISYFQTPRSFITSDWDSRDPERNLTGDWVWLQNASLYSEFWHQRVRDHNYRLFRQDFTFLWGFLPRKLKVYGCIWSFLKPMKGSPVKMLLEPVEHVFNSVFNWKGWGFDQDVEMRPDKRRHALQTSEYLVDVHVQSYNWFAADYSLSENGDV